MITVFLAVATKNKNKREDWFSKKKSIYFTVSLGVLQAAEHWNVKYKRNIFSLGAKSDIEEESDSFNFIVIFRDFSFITIGSKNHMQNYGLAQEHYFLYHFCSHKFTYFNTNI